VKYRVRFPALTEIPVRELAKRDQKEAIKTASDRGSTGLKI